MGGARHPWAHEPLNELYSGRVLSIEHLLNKEDGEDEIHCKKCKIQTNLNLTKKKNEANYLYL
jgi:hypothetical protein